jgi:hypothetical protein
VASPLPATTNTAPAAATSAAKPIIFRNNRWRCDRGWDIDLDDGSSN